MICFLIDDDLDDQEFFHLALENIDPNISCVTSDDGAIALQRLKTEQGLTPDLIFIDMRMPRMTGSEVIREIKNIPRLKDVPTILYSTSDLEIGKEEARKAGAAHFFTKPTSIPDLAASLQEVIDKFSKKG
jgi:CheY-like chemotaxis protein